MRKPRPVRARRIVRQRLRNPFPGGGHIVIAHFDGEIHSWRRPTPVAPDEQPWLDRAVEIGIRYSREVSAACGIPDAERGDERLLDVAIVVRAAEVLWAASPGSPHWRDLGTDVVERVVARPDFAQVRDNVVTVLLGVAHFLGAHRFLTAGESLVVRSRLEPLLPEWMVALGYERVTLPPDLAPS